MSGTTKLQLPRWCDTDIGQTSRSGGIEERKIVGNWGRARKNRKLWAWTAIHKIGLIPMSVLTASNLNEVKVWDSDLFWSEPKAHHAQNWPSWREGGQCGPGRCPPSTTSEPREAALCGSCKVTWWPFPNIQTALGHLLPTKPQVKLKLNELLLKKAPPKHKTNSYHLL